MTPDATAVLTSDRILAPRTQGRGRAGASRAARPALGEAATSSGSDQR